MKKISLPNLILLSVILFFLAGYVGYPLYAIISESIKTPDGISFSAYSKIFDGNVFVALKNSLWLSLITIAGSLLIGLILSATLFFLKIPLKSFFSTLFLIPIATPPIVSVTAFAYLLGEYGLLTGFLKKYFAQSTNFAIDGWPAIILIHLYSFYPYFFLFISNSLKKLDADILDASKILGASKLTTFAKIVIPHISTSVISATIIVFMASMASFSAPFIFGSSERFVTTEIYSAKVNNDYTLAAVLAVMLTTISVFFLAGVRYFDRFEKNYASKGVTKVYNVEMKKRMSIPGFIISIIISVFVLLPVLALAYLSFLPEGSLMRDVLIEKFTFENYINMFTQPELFSPFRNSILMSLVSVLMSLFIGISVAVLVARENIPGKRLVEISSTLPYAIPATVVALAFIISFNTPTIFTGFNVLVGTFLDITISLCG